MSPTARAFLILAIYSAIVLCVGIKVHIYFLPH